MSIYAGGLLIVGVTDGARQIGSVEMSELYSGAVSMKMIRKQLAPDFWPFFETLYGVIAIQEMAQKKKESSRPHSPMPSSSTSTTANGLPTDMHIPYRLAIGLLFRLGLRIFMDSIELNVSPIAPSSTSIQSKLLPKPDVVRTWISPLTSTLTLYPAVSLLLKQGRIARSVQTISPAYWKFSKSTLGM